MIDPTLPQPAPFAAEDLPGDSRQARQQARRRLIAEAVLAQGSMRIEQVTAQFGISLMTAHRDLDDLAGRGILRKSRGVASAAPTSLVEASDLYRDMRQGREKAGIAACAAQQIVPGQAIFFDDSTTVLRMVPHLAARVPLTAITNSLTLINALCDIPDIDVRALGGQLQNWSNAFVGPVTTAEAAALRVDLVFMSMSAITDGMVFHQSPEIVAVKRAMFDSAARRILLADHTKFDRRALHGMVPLDAFDMVIVDHDTPATLLRQLSARGVNIVVAEDRQD